MKKALKITGISLLAIVLILILLPFLFKGKIKEMISQQVNNNLNAKFSYTDFSLSLIRHFPNLTVELEDMTLVGIDSFQNDTLIHLKSFSAGLNLMSVINGEQIKINSIILEEPTIKVKVLKSGLANYDIAKTDTTAAPADQSDTAATKFNIKLKKFHIIDADIVYDDKSSDLNAQIENFNFKLKGDMTRDLTNLDIKSAIERLTVETGGVKYLNKARIGFVSTIEADLKNSKYTFKENEFSLNEIVLGFSGSVAMPDTNIVTDVIFKTTKTEFKSVLSLIPAIYMKDFDGIKTSGKFEFDGYAKGTYNAVNMPAFGINLIVEKARFQYPELPKSVENINIKLKVDAEEGTGENMTVDLKSGHLEMAGNPFDAVMFIKMTAADIAMSGKINGKIDLNSVKDIYPLADTDISGLIAANLEFAGNMSDIDNERYDKFKANGTLGLTNLKYIAKGMPPVTVTEAAMSFSPQFVDLSKFDCNYGKSDLHLNGKINNIVAYVFKDELLSGVFNFNANYLDLNEMMGDDTETATTAAPETASEWIEIPSNIDFTLNAGIKKMLYDKIEITETDGKIVIKDSKMSMDNLKMNLLQGAMSMTGSFDTKIIDKPKAEFLLDISRFDIPAVYTAFNTIKQMAPIAENCTGKISASLSLNTILDIEMMPVFNTLNSKGRLLSDNIGMKNNKLFGKLADASKQEKFRNPSLKSIDLKFSITDGNLVLEPTNLKVAGTDFSAEGMQNLDKTIKFNLGFDVPKDAANKLVSKLPTNQLTENVKIFAIVGGTTDDPKIEKFSSNLTEGIKEEVKEKIEEVKENVKEKAKAILDAAKKKADDLIAEAEKQSLNIRTQAQTAGQKLIDEAQNQGQKLIAQAKNPIAKKAAQISAKKLEDEAKIKADQLNQKAKEESEKIVEKARKEAEQINKNAQAEADKV